jgi:tetratricopeptide (TPR) repeat protein
MIIRRFIILHYLLSICNYGFGQDQNSVDSLKTLLVTTTGTERFGILNGLFEYYKSSEYQVALDYAVEFETLAKKFGDSVKIVEGGRKIAYSLMDLGRNEEALNKLITILAIAERNVFRFPEVKKQIKFILNNAGIACTNMGSYDKALEYHFKSLNIREVEGDKRSIGTVLNNIGLVYFSLHEHQAAIEYYLKALVLKTKYDDSNLGGILINIGLSYNALNDYKSSKDYFSKGLKACNNSCNDEIKRAGWLGIGISLLRQGDYGKAEEYLKKSLAISKGQNNILNQWSAIYQMSEIETSRGNIKKALAYLKEALILVERSDFSEPLIDTYRKYAELYQIESDYQKTAFYLGKYKQLKDSIYSDELIKNLSKIQTKFAERENIRTIESTDEALELKQQLIKQQYVQLILVVVITFIALGLLLLILRAKRKLEKEIEVMTTTHRTHPQGN